MRRQRRATPIINIVVCSGLSCVQGNGFGSGKLRPTPPSHRPSGEAKDAIVREHSLLAIGVSVAPSERARRCLGFGSGAGILRGGFRDNFFRALPLKVFRSRQRTPCSNLIMAAMCGQHISKTEAKVTPARRVTQRRKDKRMMPGQAHHGLQRGLAADGEGHLDHLDENAKKRGNSRVLGSR